MQGIPLSSYTEVLRRVPVHLNAKPAESFDAMERAGPQVQAYLAARTGKKVDDFLSMAHDLPLRAFTRLTFDELCKVRRSSDIMMDSSVEERFRNDPQFAVVNKISNSMWRWGFRKGYWNDIVAAYEGIQSFDLGLPGFEVRLDHTTGHNERGYSEHSRTFLDGVFGFLIYYRGEHVMTLGFSFSGRRILLQQVQLTKKRGNRWLFQFPSNRLEYVVSRFQQHFSSFAIYVIDGGDVARHNRRNYQDALARINERIARRAAWDKDRLPELHEERSLMTDKIKHISEETKRLATFYRNSGRYEQTAELKINGLRHYRVTSRA